MNNSPWRRAVAFGLAWFGAAPCGFAQDQTVAIEPIRPSAPIFWRPYLPAEVPPIQLGNSGRLKDLYRAGKLYLTAHDAIVLALENNIDLETARYNPILRAWNVERAEAGGALPGVPSSASAVSSVASGQGVLGSQAAAGVSISGANGTNRGASNATISQIGPVTQTLDPIIQDSTVFSHRTLPQPVSIQTLSPVLILNQRIYSASYQQGLLSGGSVTISYNNHYSNENAATDVLNPSVAPNLSIQVQHNLLSGFGIAVNERTINIQKLNLRMSDVTFRAQVIAVVANVLNAYFALVADYEDIRAKTGVLETANRFLEDNQKRVDAGTLAQLDITSAQSQVALAQQNLVNSQANFENDQLTLKNLISRTGVAEPLLASAQIVPLDRIEIPPSDDLPPVKDLTQRALITRTDLQLDKANEQSAALSNLGTRSGLLPTLVVFATETQAGLSGTARIVRTEQGIEAPDPYLVGGLGNGLAQVFRRNFPSESVGTFFSVSLKNRQAQADYAIDQLSLRQTEIASQKDLKQAQVDVMNSVVALRQARARYDAAVRGRILAQQLLEAEQKKYGLGASTPYNVIQQQRDLATGQSSEIAAEVSYSNARIQLEQTVGTILDTYHVSLEEARSGRVAQGSTLPAEQRP